MMEYVLYILVLTPIVTLLCYPSMLRVWGKLRPPLIKPKQSDLPSISFIISAFNEEQDIADKIENTLALKYPREKIEILVATDGSIDNTDEIIRSYGQKGIKLLVNKRNRGKTLALQEAIKKTSHDIIVFSDANSLYEQDNLNEMIPWFADPTVGVVCGRLCYESYRKSHAELSEIAYWENDAEMKTLEGRSGHLLTANGSILAMRREAILMDIPGELSNDFIWPVAARYQGFKCIYEPKAIAWEKAAGTSRKEFKRKTRIMLRGLYVHRQILGLRKKGIQKATFFSRLGLYLQLFFKKTSRYLLFPSIYLFMMTGPLLPSNTIGFWTAILMWLGLMAALTITFISHLLYQTGLKTSLNFAYPLAMSLASCYAWLLFFVGYKPSTWKKHRASSRTSVEKDPKTQSAFTL
jgi:cellulose synthase/poly-beta-1,6-N-acetylglucosamine synthase-like glycosyltransferase